MFEVLRKHKMAKDEKESTAYDFPKDMPKYLADKKKRAADQKAKK